jgi:hypothetical protein
MAGWIKPCPTDLGWIKPSAVITSQEIPPGGFLAPKGHFFEKWRGEIFLSSLYGFSGIVALTQALRKKNTLIPIIYGVTMIIAGLVFSTKESKAQYALYAMAAVALCVVIYQFNQGRKANPVEERND